MEATSQKTYELAYHLLPEMDEQTVENNAKEIEALIGQYGGYVVATNAPKKQHLSYPISHKRSSFFGSFDFTTSPDSIQKLDSQLKLQNNILRHLIVIKEVTQTPSISVNKKPRKTEKTAKGDTKTAGKQIEKELENVLETIDIKS